MKMGAKKGDMEKKGGNVAETVSGFTPAFVSLPVIGSIRKTKTGEEEDLAIFRCSRFRIAGKRLSGKTGSMHLTGEQRQFSRIRASFTLLLDACCGGKQYLFLIMPFPDILILTACVLVCLEPNTVCSIASSFHTVFGRWTLHSAM